MELSENQNKEALNHLLDCVINPEDKVSGIIRQIIGQGVDSLSKNQKHHYDNTIKPSLVEKCSSTSCNQPTVAGRAHCGACALEYGTDSEHITDGETVA